MLTKERPKHIGNDIPTKLIVPKKPNKATGRHPRNLGPHKNIRHNSLETLLIAIAMHLFLIIWGANILQGGGGCLFQVLKVLVGEDEDVGELEVGREELGEVDLFHLLDGAVEDKVDGLAL